MKTTKDVRSIQIKIATPEQILKWSYGEVKKPETINYRSLRPERDGLFCEKIFGTTKAWECWCGKFKSIRYRGVVCDRCGVEVTDVKVRRERMGHITLATPVAHIWFYKAPSSVISNLIEIKQKDLVSVIGYESRIITDPNVGAGENKIQFILPVDKQTLETKKNKKGTIVEFKDVLSDSECEYLEAEYGDEFLNRSGSGAEAIYEILKGIDLVELKNKHKNIKSKKEESKRNKKYLSDPTFKKSGRIIEICDDFINSNQRPENMILQVIPVIPPDLRPMVQLDGGRFATTDINELYRRVINRNNRLKRLIEISAPEIIINNEKRMLQEAVDHLLDNDRTDKPVRGSSNRKLKSISKSIQGKNGRFRQNLLGKRVDYSGRTVVIANPERKIWECGVPSEMAFELFKPFLIKKLRSIDPQLNVKKAKSMVEQHAPEVYEILDEVVSEHPVILNRAPTLHRLGVRAFVPVLVDGKAMELSPLVCRAFNADFDGDQMAIHIPLTPGAQMECWTLMLSAKNIINPANGNPIDYPTQGSVLGIYMLTKVRKPHEAKKMKYFESISEIEEAIDFGAISYNEPVYYRLREGLHVIGEDGSDTVADGKKWFETTPGRIIFNSALPKGLPYRNFCLGDKQIRTLITDTYKSDKPYVTVELLDSLNEVGFKYCYLLGGTISDADMIVQKEAKDRIQAEGESLEREITQQYLDGKITQTESHNRKIEIWQKATNELVDITMKGLEEDQDGFNPFYMMFDSGARGSKNNFRSICAWLGLMTRANGEIIEVPILENYKEGRINPHGYAILCDAARKGLTDTALGTPNLGRITRVFSDVAQDVIVTEEDCGTLNGFWYSAVKEGDRVVETLSERIIGRCPVYDIVDPYKVDSRGNHLVIARAGVAIDEVTAKQIEDADVESVFLRNVMTCESKYGVCAKCYGNSIAKHHMVNLGEALGIQAAQSIGEPGTQMNLKSFHQGGVASTIARADSLSYSVPVKVEEIVGNVVKNRNGEEVFPRRSRIVVSFIRDELAVSPKELSVKNGDLISQGMPLYEKNKETYYAKANGLLEVIDGKAYIVGAKDEQIVPAGSKLYVHVGEVVPAMKNVITFDPNATLIVAEKSGVVEEMRDFVEGRSFRRMVTESGDIVMNIESTSKLGKYKPTVEINDGALDDEGHPILTGYTIPGDSVMFIQDVGETVEAGDIIARAATGRERNLDIGGEGGIYRIRRLYNVVKSLAETEGKVILSRISGTIKAIVEKSKEDTGLTSAEVLIEGDYGIKIRHNVYLKGARLLVRVGDTVKAGEPLCSAEVNPREILSVFGEEAAANFLINEVQSVYRGQAISINDKNHEVIVRQLFKKVIIMSAGDTDFESGQKVEKLLFLKKNEEIKKEGKEPAIAILDMEGIESAAQGQASFIASAAFEEVAGSLTQAAIEGKKDPLQGIMENVIIGHLIPVGTGFKKYRDVQLDEDEKLLKLQEEIDRLRSQNPERIDDKNDDFELELIDDTKTLGTTVDLESSADYE